MNVNLSNLHESIQRMREAVVIMHGGVDGISRQPENIEHEYKDSSAQSKIIPISPKIKE